MSSPSNSAYVPYQAYKPRRHSRNLSNSILSPSRSPPPSMLSNGQAALLPPPKLSLSGEVDNNEVLNGSNVAVLGVFASDHSSSSTPADKGMTFGVNNDPLVAPSPSNVRLPTTKKTSTFRRLPTRSTPSTQPTTPHTRNASLPSLPPAVTDDRHNDAKSSAPIPALSPDPAPNVLLPPTKDTGSHSSQAPTPHIDPSSLVKTANSFSREPSRDKPLPSRPRITAPYRPGFQPKGIYRSLTDDFFELRRSKRDGEGDNRMKRVERTKLERRLEKLIALHFPSPAEKDEKLLSASRPVNRRASIFDFGSLKTMNFNDAGDLWKGLVVGNAMDSAKTDVRTAEQRITPWQDDAEVNKCPHCLASFHPLTNRKHHCRLCGRIVCSLPIKHPQRVVLCSTLFVVDKQTRQIEEVGEGVDYGVRSRRRASGVTNQQAKFEEDTKFLKGVRICRECRPVLLRQQYRQQAQIIPHFVDMYQKFISLEAEIEDALPKFQELLNHNNPPLQDATSARKRLLDSFAQYDTLAKKIRSLPCPNGPGSSQDRVQMAVVMRANLFLQKNMFPLQSLSSLRSNPKATLSPDSNETTRSNGGLPLDMDAALAHRLQPLLEQESLLEVFVEEAQAQRKFEDVKALKINLAEIRQEIEKLLDTSDTPTAPS